MVYCVSMYTEHEIVYFVSVCILCMRFIMYLLFWRVGRHPNILSYSSFVFVPLTVKSHYLWIRFLSYRTCPRTNKCFSILSYSNILSVGTFKRNRAKKLANYKWLPTMIFFNTPMERIDSWWLASKKKGTMLLRNNRIAEGHGFSACQPGGQRMPCATLRANSSLSDEQRFRHGIVSCHWVKIEWRQAGHEFN
jgi:hypothetical protein